MSPYLHIAERAALAAGKIMSLKFSDIRYLDIWEKTPNNFVSEVDIACEKEILRIILKAYPKHAVLSEESGLHGDKDSDYRWLIDPLDGTTNFLHNFPHFAVSIALMHKQEVVAGVVYDPNRNELFAAAKGQGALLNQRKIRVADRPTLQSALLGTGIPYQHQSNIAEYMRVLDGLIRGTSGVRRAGAASLDLAYVATGRLDGFWEFNLNIWDIAAGSLLVQEAGGMVGDLSGGHHHLIVGDTLAANPQLYKVMAEKIAAVLQA